MLKNFSRFIKIGFFIAAAGVLAGAGTYFVLRGSGHEPNGVGTDAQRGPANSQAPSGQALEGNGRADIYLYFSDRDNQFLIAEDRHMVMPEHPVEKGRLIVEALIEGPRNGLVRTIPEDTLINAFYLSDDGTAYVDFSETIKDGHPGGSHTEYLTVYSIVNSLVFNVPEIERVKILIGGGEAKTLAGHIGLQSPFQANMVIVR
jgi:spore germination protein GerM